MKVTYVCADPGVPLSGAKGCTVHVQEVVRALHRLGAEVDVIAAGAGRLPDDLHAVRVFGLGIGPRLGAEERERALCAANDQIGALLRESEPSDLIYERYALWSSAAMRFARSANIPGILEVNAPLIEEQARHRVLLNVSAAEAHTRSAYANASLLAAVSSEVAEYLARWPGTDGKIRVIPNGVNPERFATSPQRRAGRPFTVGFVGSLKPWHGLAHLARGFARFLELAPKSRLLIVGDGPGRGPLQAELERLGCLNAAEFTGAVAPHCVPGWLAQLDVAVAPYRADAPFYFSPLKIFEYMACGLPVVASGVGQVAQLIESDRNGLLVPPDSAEGLARALARLYRSPSLRRRLGAEARASVLQHHTWDHGLRSALGEVGLWPPGSHSAARRGGRRSSDPDPRLPREVPC